MTLRVWMSPFMPVVGSNTPLIPHTKNMQLPALIQSKHLTKHALWWGQGNPEILSGPHSKAASCKPYNNAVSEIEYSYKGRVNFSSSHFQKKKKKGTGKIDL